MAYNLIYNTELTLVVKFLSLVNFLQHWNLLNCIVSREGNSCKGVRLWKGNAPLLTVDFACIRNYDTDIKGTHPICIQNHDRHLETPPTHYDRHQGTPTLRIRNYDRDIKRHLYNAQEIMTDIKGHTSYV